MRRKTHGPAVTVVLLSLLLAGPGFPGCRHRGASEKQGPAGGRIAQHGHSAESRQELPPPQLKREVLGREAIKVPAGLAELSPVAYLPATERMLVYNAMGPLRLRVVRANGTGLAELEVQSGEVLIVDRTAGVRVSRQSGSETLVRGPLDDQAVYALFALPTGGMRQEVERSVIRPETLAERQARADAEQKAEEEARKKEQQEKEAATRPSTTPSGGG